MSLKSCSSSIQPSALWKVVRARCENFRDSSATFAAEETVAEPRNAFEDVVHMVAVLVQVGAARVGDRVDLLPAVVAGGHQTLVVEELQGGVDRSGTGPVASGGLVFQGLHDLVAVHGLLFDEAEDRELEVAALEPLPARAALSLAALPRGGSPAERPGKGVEVQIVIESHGWILRSSEEP